MTATNPNRANKREANWPHVLFFIHIHVLCMYGLWLAFTDAKILTNVLCLLLSLIGILGATSGAHRLWAHGTYKANTVLRTLLMLSQTLVGQGSIYNWVVDHRLHHEQFGTEQDPYNHNRGFSFAHLFTHLQSLSPKQQELAKAIDVTDLEKDSIVMFQHSYYYWILYPVVFLLLPINAPVEYWGETIMNSVFIIGFLRYAIVLHASWFINSGALVWGLKPGDKYPADTNMVFILTKSYWPQYHYLLPCDYKSGEYGSYATGCSTTFIRIWAAMGWATGLRTMDSGTVKAALAAAVTSGKSISDCLHEAEKAQTLPGDHFLDRADILN